MDIKKLKLNPSNPRIIKDDKFKKLVDSILCFPQMLEKRKIVCVTDADKKIFPLGGNMRYKALLEISKMGKEKVLKFLKDSGKEENINFLEPLFKGEISDSWVVLADDWSEEQRKEFIIKDNVSFGEWDFDELANNWNNKQLSNWGVDLPEWEMETESECKEKSKKLSDRFIIPPFSVLDTKSGDWQKRKNYWMLLGIKSEIGREDNSLGLANIKEYDYEYKGAYDISSGTSIFDPVLCELAYKWFNVPNGKILDCFAGGSVRGIIAAKLGYEYLGNDLRREQIDANRINAKEVLQDTELYPTWTCGDSLNIDTIAKGYEADLILSCPPYADLEVYSDKKEDLSNMSYKDFITVYREIIRKTCSLLKQDRFAVFVVGDVRDKKGFYQNFVSDTIQAFIDSGLMLYNEMILVNMIGNLAMRASKYFNGGRKIGKQHQNVLVFYKGNPKKIKENYPELDLSYMSELDLEIK